MISKKNFVRIIKNIQEQHKIDLEISDALQKVCGSYVIFNTENLIYNSLHQLLEEVFNDEDYIGWWLYENVDKKIYIDEEVIDVSTPERFYDFLIDNMK